MFKFHESSFRQMMISDLSTGKKFSWILVLKAMVVPALKKNTIHVTDGYCHSSKLKLAFTSPNVIPTSPQYILISRIDLTVLLQVEFLKILHLPVGQVKNTEFTNSIAKSTSPGLSDTTFFARWKFHGVPINTIAFSS